MPGRNPVDGHDLAADPQQRSPSGSQFPARAIVEIPHEGMGADQVEGGRVKRQDVAGMGLDPPARPRGIPVRQGGRGRAAVDEDDLRRGPDRVERRIHLLQHVEIRRTGNQDAPEPRFPGQPAEYFRIEGAVRLGRRDNAERAQIGPEPVIPGAGFARMEVPGAMIRREAAGFRRAFDQQRRFGCFGVFAQSCRSYHGIGRNPAFPAATPRQRAARLLNFRRR